MADEETTLEAAIATAEKLNQRTPSSRQHSPMPPPSPPRNRHVDGVPSYCVALIPTAA